MTEKRQALLSGAIQQKPEGNQRWGETVGTLKLFENERYDGDEKHPNITGYIIINETNDPKNAKFYPVSVWSKLPLQ
jgi:hypothetical protein